MTVRRRYGWFGILALGVVLQIVAPGNWGIGVVVVAALVGVAVERVVERRRRVSSRL